MLGGGVAVVFVLALAFWLLFIRTPDGGKPASSNARSGVRALTPTFPSIASETAPTSTSDASAVASSSATDSASSEGVTTTTGTEPTTSATITDPVGDRTFSADPPPPWADLAGATLTRSSAGYELRVRLGGGSAPSTTDANHTMNIASFYDLDGDGTIDYEVWANLADTGWATSWFDDRTGGAHFNGDSGVTSEVVDDSLVLRFALDHIASAATFRWSLASEWGGYGAIGTDLAARDDAPDNDRPARFPA